MKTQFTMIFDLIEPKPYYNDVSFKNVGVSSNIHCKKKQFYMKWLRWSLLTIIYESANSHNTHKKKNNFEHV